MYHAFTLALFSSLFPLPFTLLFFVNHLPSRTLIIISRPDPIKCSPLGCKSRRAWPVACFQLLLFTLLPSHLVRRHHVYPKRSRSYSRNFSNPRPVLSALRFSLLTSRIHPHRQMLPLKDQDRRSIKRQKQNLC